MLDLEKAASKDIEQIAKAKRQYFDQRREYNKLVTQQARNEHLEEVIRECVRNVEKEKPFIFWTPDNDHRKRREAVVVFSDWHYGLVAENIWNRYNVEICRERVRRLVQKTAEKIAMNDVSALHVVILGDMAAGSIHTSVRVAAEEVACDQLIHVSELIAEAIAALAPVVPHVYVYSTYGNHMRTTAALKDSIHHDNMERIIAWWLKERFANHDTITVVESNVDDLIRMNVCGYNIFATHGDLDVGKDSAIKLNVLSEKVYGRGIDYFITAHMHHTESLENLGIEHIQVGCLCGSDEYAKTRRLYATPSQTVMIFTPGEGIDSVSNIKFVPNGIGSDAQEF